MSLLNISSLVSLSTNLQAKLCIGYDAKAGEIPCTVLHICSFQCSFYYFTAYI